MPDMESPEIESNDAPYVVVTGESRVKNIGLLILSLLAVAFLGTFVYFFRRVSGYVLIAALTFLGFSLAKLIGGGRTEWTFGANGIKCRKHMLVGARSRHIPIADIAAVGVETGRVNRVTNPLFFMNPWLALDVFSRESAKAEPATKVYRLAFKLHSGEALFIDDQQPAALFTERLGQLSRRMPRLNWPVIDQPEA